jgi:hypothetical protein
VTWRLDADAWTLKVSAIATRPELEAFDLPPARPIFVTLQATVRVAPAEAALELRADLLILEQGPGYCRTLYTLGDLTTAELARQTAERLVAIEFGKADPQFGRPWPTPEGRRPLPRY